jgi:rSAM/selenodomain-associated transferase 2
MISIIIPTFNEAASIAETILKTKTAIGKGDMELIVADGGSSDETVSIAQSLDVTVIKCRHKGRATQMNEGAIAAKGDILYFLHADSIPPNGFNSHILHARQNGAISGCFQLSFDYTHWFLKTNCWFTRFNINAVRFGDQSLFVTKDVFIKCGGFREDLIIMEDQEIIHRIKQHGKFKVMNAKVITSARKYLHNGIFRMQFIFYRTWLLYQLGFTQSYLMQMHRNIVRKHKF